MRRTATYQNTVAAAFNAVLKKWIIPLELEKLKRRSRLPRLIKVQKGRDTGNMARTMGLKGALPDPFKWHGYRSKELGDPDRID